MFILISKLYLFSMKAMNVSTYIIQFNDLMLTFIKYIKSIVCSLFIYHILYIVYTRFDSFGEKTLRNYKKMIYKNLDKYE